MEKKPEWLKVRYNQDAVNEVAAQQRWDESSLTVKNFYAVFDKKF